MSGLLSVLIPTFGRAPDFLWLLEECIQSCLDQTYDGLYEIVLLNDLGCQTLTCKVPGVRVFNYPQRIRSLGEKRNELVRLARGNVLLVQDDDDLSLPSRLSQAVERLGDRYGYFNPQRSFWLNGSRLHSDHNHGVVHNASAFTRSAWEAVGGYPDESVTEDVGMDGRLKRGVAVAPPLGNDSAEWSHIYRFNISNHHISGGGNPVRDWERWGRQSFPPGTWEVVPRYRPQTLEILGHLLG